MAVLVYAFWSSITTVSASLVANPIFGIHCPFFETYGSKDFCSYILYVLVSLRRDIREILGTEEQKIRKVKICEWAFQELGNCEVRVN